MNDYDYLQRMSKGIPTTISIRNKGSRCGWEAFAKRFISFCLY